MIKLFNRLSQRRVKALLSGFLTITLGATILSPSAEARLIFTTEDDGAESDTYTLDVDGTVNPGDNIDLSLIFGANLGEELRYNDSLGYFLLTDTLNLEGNELQEFRIGSNAGAPVVCNAANVGYTYYDTTTASVMICNETSVGSGTYAFNSVEDITAGSITTTEILDGTIATVDIADNAVTTDKIGTAGVADANSLLGTDAAGNPQWEDKSDFVSSALTSGQVLVGNGSGVATGVNLSGDATINNSGIVTLTADSVDSAEIAANAVDTAELAADAVTSAKILDGTVTIDDLANNSVGAGELADNAVDSAAIVNDAVTADKIADGAISGGLGGQITDGTITADDLATNSVDSAEIATDAVGATELANNAVDTAAVLDDAITVAKIGTAGAGDANTVLTTDASGNPQWEDRSAFATSNLASGNIFVGNALNNAVSVTASGDVTIDNIGAFTITTDAVTGAEILDGSVDISDDTNLTVTDGIVLTGDELSATLGTTVDSSEIVDETIVSADIDDGTITAADLNLADVTLADFTNDLALNDTQVFVGDGSNVATGVTLSGDATITNTGVINLATDSVDSDEIVTGAVTSNEIADETIVSADIDDGTIATADIADNAIDGTKLGIGTTAGDTLFYDGTDWVRLGIGTAGQVLQTNAGATAPEWAASVSSFDGLSDTNFAGLANGNITVYDLVNTEWVNVAIGGDATIDETGDLQIAADAVTAAEIATGAVGTDEIADGSITASDLDAAFEITGAEITDGTVGVDDLGTGSVGSDEIIDGSVDISDDTNLAAGTGATLTGDTISVDLGTTIDSSEIEADTIVAADIAADAITASELADDAVDNGAIATDAVDGTQISLTGEAEGDLMYFDGTDWVSLGIGTAGQVLQTNGTADAPEWTLAAAGNLSGLTDTNLAALAAGNVLVYDAVNGEWDNVAISGDATIDATGDLQIIADAITAAEIATGAVTTDEILDGTILAGDIAANTITAGEIAADAITASELADNAVDTAAIQTNAVTASELADNAVDTAAILDDAVTADKIDLTDVTLADFTNDLALTDTQVFVGNGSNVATGVAISGDATIDNTGALTIAADAVTGAEILDGSVDVSDDTNLAAGTGATLTGDTISVDLGTTIESAEITDETIVSADILNGTITADDLGTDSVDTDEIAADAVTITEIGTAGIADGDSVLTTDVAGNPQWEDRSNFATSTLTTDNILVGNGSNVATDTAVSGDLTMTGGNFQLVADSVTAAEIATGAVDTDEIATDAVTAAEIATSAVTTDEILDGTILAGDLAAGSVSGGLAGTITDGSITADDLGTGSVGTDEIIDGSVDVSDDTNLAAGTGITLTGDTLSADLGTTIDSSEIEADTIVAADIATSAVTTDEILDGTILAGDLAAGSVSGGLAGTITDGSITADDLGTGSVDSDEIATDAVGSAEIAADAVTASELADDAVDTAAILDDAVDGTKISLTGEAEGDLMYFDGTDWVSLGIGTAGQVLQTNGTADAPEWTLAAAGNFAGLSDTNLAALADGQVAVYDADAGEWINVTVGGDVTFDDTGDMQIIADAITAAEIATGAVTTDEILDGTIVAGDIAANTITAGEIAADAITASELADNAVDTAAIQADAVTAAEIATGAVTTAEILDGTIVAGDIATDTITASEIATGAVGTDEIADGSITAADLDAAFEITGAEITDGTISAADLGTDSVDTDEIAADAVTAAEIATGAVTTDEILDATIATADIADGAITGGLGGIISDGSITADDLGTDSVDSDEIATDAVTTDEILDGTVTRDDLEEIETFYTLAPEFSNFSLRADGSDNRGTMESGYDGRNFYQWSTRRTGELNDYDLVLQWMVPENFTGFSDTNPEIEIDYKTDTTNTLDNRLDLVELRDTNGSIVAMTGNTGLVSAVADTWVPGHDVTFATGTFNPGEYLTLIFRFSSEATTRTNLNPVFLGPVKFNIKVK